MLVLLALVIAGCGATETGPLVTDEASIPLDGAAIATISVEQGAGEMTLSGGAAGIMEASFTYNVPQWKPEVTYDVTGNRGRLTVRQPRDINLAFGEQRYEWDIRLTDDVPLNLSVSVGAGTSEMDLGSLSLTGFELQTGAGGATIDLSGYDSQGFRAVVRGGAGRIAIILPTQPGVSLTTRLGVGQLDISGLTRQGDIYVNEAYGSATEVIDVVVEAGVGKIDVRME